MFFYDTCSLLNGYSEIFKNIQSDSFVISNITLSELENIKSSKLKDECTKFKAKKVIQLLNLYYDKYIIVNYNKDWDDTYISPNPILLPNNDSRIIITAFIYTTEHPDVIFVTDDISCNNIARSLGIDTKILSNKEDFNYKGYKIHQCLTDNDVAETYTNIYEDDDNRFGLLTNEYLLIKQNNKVIDIYVNRPDELKQVQFNTFKSKMFGEVKPLDSYQRMAIDSLKNNTITMLRGSAGVGKSHLAFGCLFDYLESGRIDKIIMFCNTVATANSAKLGYYPGSRTEKLLDSQIGNFLISKLGDRTQVERLIAEGLLILLPMSDLRGFDTTGMRAGIYITEAQNLDIELMKLALQRIGDDAICILDGDSDTQVDLGIYAGLNNGMRRVSEVYKGRDFYGEVTLPICHRSKIAEIADLM